MKIDELCIALEEALRLAQHYAKLLNQYDGGQRTLDVFSSSEAWIARLRETGTLPKHAGRKRKGGKP